MKRVIITALVSVVSFLLVYFIACRVLGNAVSDMFPALKSAIVVAAGVVLGLAIGYLVGRGIWKVTDTDEWQ